ncbi:hypothetical protein C4J81_18125 [Deltaproteobacteria bacterium Smac51]|nr:hypothetical protein C4J81_18125 [Deltaproteobacteria bacterium Smac51]
MFKRILPLMILASLVAASGCGAPAKVTTPLQPVCSSGTFSKTSLGGVPYNRLDKAACARAIEPFDISIWIESPYNSRKMRGRNQVLLGCKPLTSTVDDCDYCGIPGHSATAMLNFDPTGFPDDAQVRRVVLAVHSPDNADRLAQAQLRGRLNVGDELQSLGSPREIVTRGSNEQGWVLFDISLFGARAISERRNSIYFELSMPCQTPADNSVTMSLLKNEARLIVEYY